MRAVARKVLDFIGDTPMVKITRLSKGEILRKAEFLNPGGSIKDRMAKYIIEMAEKEGKLRPGSVIAEATSGNTGIGVTMVGVQKGYRVIIIMPENMSEERKKIITALGGELVLTPAEKSLPACLEKLDEIRRTVPDVFVPGQFTNPNNPEIQYLTTGPEIWRQVEERVDVFVAGVGSGGTPMGVGRFLHEKNPKVQIVAVEPKNNSALLGREPGLHMIQGIGDGFVTDVVDCNKIDIVMTVTDEDAIETTRQLARREGLLVGTSSGANVWCAMHFADGKRSVATVLPDRAERYFGTALI
ncbi:MAG: cysteine synthase family protein [Deltaproteobacteria bacterium]|nr:cysteine synthase family protein [Deltaproteobacteria bacterium]